MKKLTIVLLLLPFLVFGQQRSMLDTSKYYYIAYNSNGEKNLIHADSVCYGCGSFESIARLERDSSVVVFETGGWHSRVRTENFDIGRISDVSQLDSFYLSTEKPPSTWEDNPLTLGVAFKAAVAGTIKMVKFYKTDPRATPYYLAVWSNDGTELVNTLISSASTGWIKWPCNIAVSAGQTYVASVYNPVGKYGYGSNGNPRTRGNLSTSKGRYIRGSNGFPNKETNDSYYIDVVFEPNPTVPLSVKTSPDRDATMYKDSVGVSAVATGYTKFQWTVEDFEGRFTLKDTNTLKPYVIPLDSSGCRVWLFCTVTDASGNQQSDAVAIRIAPHPKMVLGYYLVDGTFVWRVPPMFIEFPTPATYVRP